MKSIFKMFKDKISNSFKQIKYFFSSLFINKQRLKKTVLYCGLMLVLMPLGYYSAILGTSTLKINKTQSIAELIAKNNTKKDMLGFLYGYETSNDTFELCSVRPELSKEIRSVKTDDKWELYDVYPRQFNGSTPGIVNYLDKSNVEISFLLIPKEYYTFSEFQYPFELICGGTNNKSNVEDIYINQKYADYLLNINNLSENNYVSLLNTKTEIPYKNKYLVNDAVKLSYTIKGVIKEDSAKYQYYKKYFGDFFLANQYLSLPLSSGMCFPLMNDTNSIREQLDLIYRVCNYETAGRNFDALSFVYKYDYRTVGISVLEDKNSIDSIYSKNNQYINSLNALYDYYFYKQYIIPFVFIIAFDLIICSLLIWSFLRLLKLFKTPVCVAYYLVATIISLSAVLLINKVSLLTKILKTDLSTKSWQAFVAMAIQLVLITLIILIIHSIQKKLKFKKNKDNKE